MEAREAMTIRFPHGLLPQARGVKSEQESLNDFVVEAVEHEVRRRQGLAAHEEIQRLRDEIRARTGLHPDSAPLIRALREGAGRSE